MIMIPIYIVPILWLYYCNNMFVLFPKTTVVWFPHTATKATLVWFSGQLIPTNCHPNNSGLILTNLHPSNSGLIHATLVVSIPTNCHPSNSCLNPKNYKLPFKQLRFDSHKLPPKEKWYKQLCFDFKAILVSFPQHPINLCAVSINCHQSKTKCGVVPTYCHQS